MELQGFGNGSDGPLTISSNTTEAPIDSSCSGAASSQSLSATNALFSDDQLIMIHQTRGNGAGSWEFNFVDSYVAGTITTQFPLVNTYTDSGASQAQVRTIPQYSKVVIQSGATYNAKAWNQNVGGILAFLVSGEFINEGTVKVNGGNGATGTGYPSGGTGGGFYGGRGRSTSGSQGAAYQGEGTGGAGSQSTAANGNGGGAGQISGANSAGGGGGGHAYVGQNGTGHQGSGNPSDTYIGGTGGAISGNVNPSISMTFGGGGGGGTVIYSNSAGGGGGAGGIIMIWAESITTPNGLIQSNGGNGGNAGGGSGGGGGGGTVYLRSITMVIGVNKISTIGGNGVAGNSGNGSVGRIRLECCSISGSTTQGNVSQVVGGFDFCQTMIHIYG